MENREIDAMIAYHLFGWRFFECMSKFILRPAGFRGTQAEGWIPFESRYNEPLACPPYCADWGGIELVAKEMTKRGFYLRTLGDSSPTGKTHAAEFIPFGVTVEEKPTCFSGFAPTLPKAIALAALHAVTGEYYG